MTMINAAVAAQAGITPTPGAPTHRIRGVNGIEDYPGAYGHVRVAGVEVRVLAAIGGSQGVLVGLDVMNPLFAQGLVVAREN